jgi:hypothetical protein
VRRVAGERVLRRLSKSALVLLAIVGIAAVIAVAVYSFLALA